MNQHEHNLQVACVRWFRMQYPKYAKLLFAIPNGGKRHPTVAKKMKAEGVQKGVPDLFLATAVACDVDGYQWHGLFIEMKSEEGRLTLQQAEYLTSLDQQRYKTAVCRTFDEFKNVIDNYLL